MSEVVKHTPGPLSVEIRANGQFGIVSDFNNREGEWDDIYVSMSGFVGAYNPHMFAAAPELLEACRLVVFWHAKRDDAENILHRDAQEPEIAAAMDAISKAEGR